MASKQAPKKKGPGESPFPPGTRHGYAPTLATLTRTPLAIPASGRAAATESESRRQFILNLLTQAGKVGLTWAEIQSQLVAKYGSAPKKRSALYGVLSGLQWFKVVGSKGVVSYHLGRPPRRRAN
jgi:hypothetical protein